VTSYHVSDVYGFSIVSEQLSVLVQHGKLFIPNLYTMMSQRMMTSSEFRCEKKPECGGYRVVRKFDDMFAVSTQFAKEQFNARIGKHQKC